jgi:hypothetical protein
MSYERVIPRDLFNESALLKCLGRFYILTESDPRVEIHHTGTAFDIWQRTGCGSLFVRNIEITIKGRLVSFRRSLNARDSWSLWAETWDEEVVEVFNSEGNFTQEMLDFMEGLDNDSLLS